MEWVISNFDWRTATTRQQINDVVNLWFQSEDFQTLCMSVGSDEDMYDSYRSACLVGSDLQDIIGGLDD